MNHTRSFTVSLLLFIASASLYVVPRAQPPAPQGPDLNASYVDADTGHRVVRLTDESGGSTLYFHDNAFSPEGDRLMLHTPNGIAIVEVAKIGARRFSPSCSGTWRRANRVKPASSTAT